MIMVGLPFVPHTAVPHRPQSMSLESLQSSVEWIAATGFPLQMEKKKKAFLLGFFVIRNILDAIAKNSENYKV